MITGTLVSILMGIIMSFRIIIPMTIAKRQEWVARPIHDKVFNPLLDLTDKVGYTLQTIEHNWNL